MLSRLIESILSALRQLFGGSADTTARSTAPTTTTATADSGSAPVFLGCPNETEQRASQTIGPEGGTLSLGEHRLVVPKDGVAETVELTAVLLADELLKLQLQANGKDAYQFGQPASLTLSYAKCDPKADPQRLRVYKIDPATGKVLQDLGGKVSVEGRSVTAALQGFSIYTLGSPTDRPEEPIP